MVLLWLWCMGCIDLMVEGASLHAHTLTPLTAYSGSSLVSLLLSALPLRGVRPFPPWLWLLPGVPLGWPSVAPLGAPLAPPWLPLLPPWVWVSTGIITIAAIADCNHWGLKAHSHFVLLQSQASAITSHKLLPLLV